MRWFVLCTGGTGGNVIVDVVLNGMPPEVLPNKLSGAVLTRVTRELR